MTVALPLPSASTKASPTPKASTASPRNSPSPTRTQTQNPVLTGSANASCSDDGADWVVTVSVTAALTGASAGTDPQGQAGKPGELQTFAMSGGGGTSFSGQRPVTIAPNTDPAPSGSLQWRVTVTVPGTGPKEVSGSVPYTCGA